jgi:hypothetical protein
MSPQIYFQSLGAFAKLAVPMGREHDFVMNIEDSRKPI